MEPGEVLRDETDTVGVKKLIREKGRLPAAQGPAHPPAVPQVQSAISEVVGQMGAQIGSQRPGADDGQDSIY